jgi:hypothetical protein
LQLKTVLSGAQGNSWIGPAEWGLYMQLAILFACAHAICDAVRCEAARCSVPRPVCAGGRLLVEHDPNALEKFPRSVAAAESATNRVA